MKKAYIVTYVNDKAGINRQQMQEQLQTIGAYKELSHAARTASWMIIPDDEAANASMIKNKLFAALKPFEDSISIVRIDANDVADTDGLDSTEFLTKCKGNSRDEPLNFSRFSSRHEAFLQYQLERPMWIYDDGTQYGVGVDFAEWCWLPIRKDGMYEKRKYQSYIYN